MAHKGQDTSAAVQQDSTRLPYPSLPSSVQIDAGTPDSNGSLRVPFEVHEALIPKVVVEKYEHPFSPWRRRYMVALVAIITAMLCADQNLLAPNLSAAAAYFGLDERQKDTYLGGYLMAAFFLVGAPAALVCGWLADKYNRVYMLVSIIIIGETPCLCTYWVTALWQFFLIRMLTGIAVGGCFPLVFSLLGDLFPISQRSAMAALVQIAVGAGIGGGQMLAGIVGPATNWKVPFVVMAAPSLALAIVLLATAKEPPRGAFEEALSGQLAAGEAYSETVSWSKVKRMLRIPSNWLIILQGLPGCLPWGVMQTYINDYLHLNKGLSIELATVVILLFGIGGGVGVVAGGAAGQLLYNWRKESMPVLTGVSVLLGAGPVWAIINADVSFGVILVLSALAGFLVSIAGPNLRAIMINVNTPETRGVALALQSVTDDLGRGLGPVIVAGFISQLGRVGAFNISVAGWIPCGILLCCLVFTIRPDESSMQRQLAQKSEVALQQIRINRGSAAGDAGLEPVMTLSSSQDGLAAIAAAATDAETQLLRWRGGSSGHGSSPRVITARQLAHTGRSKDDASVGFGPATTTARDLAGMGQASRDAFSDPGACNAADPERLGSRQQLLELHRLAGGSSSSMAADQMQTLTTSVHGEDLAPSAVLSGASTRYRGSQLHGRNGSGSSGSSNGRGHSSMGSGEPVAESTEATGGSSLSLCLQQGQCVYKLPGTADVGEQQHGNDVWQLLPSIGQGHVHTHGFAAAAVASGGDYQARRALGSHRRSCTSSNSICHGSAAHADASAVGPAAAWAAGGVLVRRSSSEGMQGVQATAP